LPRALSGIERWLDRAAARVTGPRKMTFIRRSRGCLNLAIAQ